LTVQIFSEIEKYERTFQLTKMKDSIKSYQHKIAEICLKYQIRELSLFGSRARDDSSANSDFDFLVEFAPEAEIGFITLGKIRFELEDVVKAQVDLVPKSGLKAGIRQQILAEAELIYVA